MDERSGTLAERAREIRRHWETFISGRRRERALLIDAAHRALTAGEGYKAERDELRAALTALVNQLDVVHADSQYASVWTLHMIHGGEYTGPQYEKELNAARDSLQTHGRGSESTPEAKQEYDLPDPFGLGGVKVKSE